MAAEIPDKLFLKIGEAADIASLRPSVLRFWESEFDLLKPKKSRSGQRLYSQKDIETILEIKRLLYTEKLTIEGARARLAARQKSEIPKAEVVAGTIKKLQGVIDEIREELKIFRDSL